MRAIAKMREEEKSDALESQLEAQMELATLNRHYRTMFNDKKAYINETQNAIRRQKAAIENLLQERKHLIALGRVAGRLWNKFCDENNLDALTELLDKEQVVLAAIKEERKLIAETERKEKDLEEKINDWRRTMKGGKDSQMKYIATQKHIRFMQNRLDNTSKKFNSAMARNQNLRKHIDDMRCQKAHFQTLFQSLENKISNIRVDIQKTSESATANFNARDEAQHRMASLRERGVRDLDMFNSDVKDFLRAIEHDRKLREFMTAKAKDRASILREEMMKRALRKHGIHLDGMTTETKKYEMIFEKIKDATGIYDSDTLVTSFIQTEDENFALFNYVNTMNTEIEGLQEDIELLQREIKKTSKEEITSNAHRHEIYKELQIQYKKLKAQCNTLINHTELDRRILDISQTRIEKLFKKIKCDRSAISELLGGGTTIDDYNVMQYLGIIEQKCNELLQIKAMSRLKSGAELDPKEVQVLESLQGVGPQPDLPPLDIAPPRIEEDTEGLPQVVDTKPLTTSEVHFMLKKQGLTSRLSNTPPTAKGNKKKRA